MALNPYETYRQQEVLLAGRNELLLMLYDGCIKSLKLARIAIEEKNVEGAHTSLMKAQAILSKLTADLDMSYEISSSLMGLYRFFQRQLTEANIKKDAALIGPVLEMLTDLRNTWQMAVAAQRGSGAGAAAGRWEP